MNHKEQAHKAGQSQHRDRGAEHMPLPKRKPVHHSWLFWVVLVTALVALLFYSFL